MISIKKCWGSQLGPRNQVGINWAQTFSNQSFYQGRHICKSIVSWLHFVISVENWYFAPTWSDPNFAIFGNSVWSDMWGGLSSVCSADFLFISLLKYFGFLPKNVGFPPDFLWQFCLERHLSSSPSARPTFSQDFSSLLSNSSHETNLWHLPDLSFIDLWHLSTF